MKQKKRFKNFGNIGIGPWMADISVSASKKPYPRIFYILTSASSLSFDHTASYSCFTISIWLLIFKLKIQMC